MCMVLRMGRPGTGWGATAMSIPKLPRRMRWVHTSTSAIIAANTSGQKMAKGRAMRRKRFFSMAWWPRCAAIIAAKKPASTKKVGMRNAWMNNSSMSATGVVAVSRNGSRAGPVM